MSGKAAYPPAASPEQTIWCWAEAAEATIKERAKAHVILRRVIVLLPSVARHSWSRSEAQVFPFVDSESDLLNATPGPLYHRSHFFRHIAYGLYTASWSHWSLPGRMMGLAG